MVYFIVKDVNCTKIILDDVTPFGITVPERAMQLLRDKASAVILNAEELSVRLLKKLPRDVEDSTFCPLSGGGVMAFTLLRRAGLAQNPSSVIDAVRTYKEVEGKLRPSVAINGALYYKPGSPPVPTAKTVIIDDVVASGRTIDSAARYLNSRGLAGWPNAITLLLSSSTSGGYRTSSDSTLQTINDLYSAVRARSPAGGCPVIFSLRALLEKREYAETEAARKLAIDGKELVELLNGVDRSLLKIMRRDPLGFIDAQTE